MLNLFRKKAGKIPKSFRIAVLVVASALLFSSCSGNAKGGDPVMTINSSGETISISSNIFSYYLSLRKTLELYQYNYYAQMYGIDGVDDSPELWNQPYTIEEDPSISTYGDIIKISTTAEIQQLLAIQAYCAENGISLSKEQVNDIDVAIKNLIRDTYSNSKVRLNTVLNRFGVNDSIYKEIKQIEKLRALFTDHLFAEGTGIKAISDSAIWQNFNDNYVRVKHILIRTITAELDENGAPVNYSDEELAERVAKADDIYNKIIGGENFDDYYAESEDTGQESYPNGYCFARNSGFYEEFENAAFDMEIGEVRKVETSVGIHIIKKFELTTEDIAEYQDLILQELQSMAMSDVLNPYIDTVEVMYDEINEFSVVNADTMMDCLDIVNLS